ncbi:hypothetical protein EV195_103230 [Tenacibaculum skagerrakense]|uniref:Uncharacterized protein n=1 Tax=Tenacibaculum skagerrakense TaxID=186571 RepID=A0A4R2NW81_9FLAO|nr:hypothetical protein [Tenacibaculum skagerrakense]TCP25868.1 hypothetical protein EV195_103230 [Tenacibaculum skagerrakense]
MKYYNSDHTVSVEGIFRNYENGYYKFELLNGDFVDFEQINNKVLHLYDLKSKEFVGKKFSIEYIEIIDDLDDDDFVAFKLNNLTLL